MSESKFLPFQDADGDLHNDVCKTDDIVFEAKVCPTCTPNESALVPDWKKEKDPFLNEKNCKYQINYRTTEPNTGYSSGMSESEAEEKLNEIYERNAEDAITELLEFYNKETTVGAKALLKESIEYTNYDLVARSESKLKLLYSVPHDILEAVGPADSDEETEDDTGDIEVTYSTADLQEKLLRIRKGLKLYNRYYRIFSATSSEVQTFVYTSGKYSGKTFVLQDYGDYGLGINAGKRAKLEAVYQDLAKFLKDKGFAIRAAGGFFGAREPVTKIEMSFDQFYDLKKLKVFTEKCGIKPTVFTTKLKNLKKLDGWRDKTAVAYFAQLDNMDNDIQARTPKAWIDFVEEYTYPRVELKGANEALAAVQSAPGCVAQAIGDKVFDGSLFDQEFSFSDALAVKWYDTYCNSSQEDVESLKEILGLNLTRGERQVGRSFRRSVRRFNRQNDIDVGGPLEDLYKAAQEQAYEIINTENDPFQLVCVGALAGSGFKVDSLRDILNELKQCGLEAALTQAITCLFGGLTLEQALSSVINSALKAMNIQNLNDLFVGLPPEDQAKLNELAQQKLKEGNLFKSQSTNQDVSDAIAGNYFETLQDLAGRTEEDRPEDRVNGWFERDEGKILAQESDPNAQKRTLAQRFDNPGGKNQETIVAAYVSALLEYYADNLLDLVDQLNRFPGARLISNALLSIDCPRPPLFNPGVFEFIRDLELPFCRNMDDITLPKLVNPFGWVPEISDILGALFKALKDAIVEIVISILVKLFIKICDIIGSAVCKTLETVGSLAAGVVTDSGSQTLSSIFREAVCGEDADDSQINDAIVEMFANFGVGAQAFANQEQTLSLAESMANTMTQSEMANAFLGEVSPEASIIMSEIVASEFSDFEDAIGTPDQISQMFKSMGDLLPASYRDTLRDIVAGIPDDDQTPVNPSLCATEEQLEDFCAARANILDGRASPEQIKALCDTQFNPTDLSDLQSALDGDYIQNNMPPITSDPGCDNGLLPYEPDETINAVTTGLGTDLEILQIDYSTDMIGNGPLEKNWGMVNMMMSDTEGIPLTAHIRKASLNPFYVDQYGTFFPDPKVIAAAGLVSPVTAIILKTLDESGKSGAYPEKMAAYLQLYMNGDIDENIFEVEFNNSNLDFAKDNPDITLSYSDYANGYRQLGESGYEYGFNIEAYTAEFIESSDGNPINIYSDNMRIVITERNNLSAKGNKSALAANVVLNAEYDVLNGSFPSGSTILGPNSESEQNSDLNEETIEKYNFLTVDNTFDELGDVLNNYTSFQESFISDTEYQPQTNLLREIVSNENNIKLNSISALSFEQYRTRTSKDILDNIFKVIADRESEVSAWSYGATAETLIQEDTDYGIKDDNGTWVLYKDTGLTDEDAILGISYDQYKNEVSGTLDNTRVFYLDPEQFGGSYKRPGIYVKPPEFSGWFGLIDALFPEYSPCKPQSTNLVDFDSIKQIIDELYPNIPEDERLKSDPDCIVELPYNRVLERPAKAAMIGLIIAACRIFSSAHIIKSLPTFAQFAPKFPQVYSTAYASYIIEVMEDAFKNAKGADWELFGGFSDESFWYGFLEQCVQMYSYRVDIGEIEPPESVLKALMRLNNVQASYEYPLDRSEVRGDIGVFQSLKSYRQEKNLEVVKKTEEDAKIVMKEWVVEQLNYMSGKLITNLEDIGFGPEIKDIEYYILEEYTAGTSLTLNKNIDSDGRIMATYGDLPSVPFGENDSATDPYYTYGGELIVKENENRNASLMVGQEYIGYYHVHINENGDIVYMVGEYHSNVYHPTLTPISNITTVAIGDVNDLGTTTEYNGKQFLLEKYVKINEGGGAKEYSTEDALEIIRSQEQSLLVSEVFPGTMELITNENGDATGITGELGLRYGLKFSAIIDEQVYKITSVEIDALDLPLSEYKTLSANSLNLYCLLKELKHDDKFKMLFKYIIPVNKLVSLAAIYNDMAMFPSIGQIIVEESFGLETSVEERLTITAGQLPDTVDTLLEQINTEDLDLSDRREGAWAHPRDRSSRNGLLVQSWDTWDRELLINSTARIKKLFKSYYNSRDFDPSTVSENVDGPGKIFEKSLRDLFRPAAGRQLLPWYKRRNLKENPFNSLGEICKKDD